MVERCNQARDITFRRIARQEAGFGQEVARLHRGWQRQVFDHFKEVIEGIQCGQPSVNRSCGMPFLQAVSDEVIHITGGDLRGWLVCKCKKRASGQFCKSPWLYTRVSAGAGCGILAGEPVFEMFDLRVHESLLGLGFGRRGYH